MGGWRTILNRLVAHLLENLILDFQGDLTLEMVRDFLREDNSHDARQLLAKVVADGGPTDMMIVVADCLRDNLKTGIDGDAMGSQLRTYSES